ncbi:MAG: hypothetical protein V4635_05960 [Bacteroidota bacterium]
MRRAIKIITWTIAALLLIVVGLWFINFEIPNMRMRSINDKTIDNIDFYEKTVNEITLNFDTLKVKYKRKYENSHLDCIAEIPGRVSVTDRTDKVDKQKYLYVDSLFASAFASQVYLNADSSIYFQTECFVNSAPLLNSYVHFVCFDSHKKTSSLKFLEKNNIVNQETIKPNWTYVVIRTD